MSRDAVVPHTDCILQLRLQEVHVDAASVVVVQRVLAQGSGRSPGTAADVVAVLQGQCSWMR